MYLSCNNDASFYILHIEVLEKLIYAKNRIRGELYSLKRVGIEAFLVKELLVNVPLSRVIILSMFN